MLVHRGPLFEINVWRKRPHSRAVTASKRNAHVVRFEMFDLRDGTRHKAMRRVPMPTVCACALSVWP